MRMRTKMWWIVGMLGLLLAAGCAPETCRFDPECGGGVGAICRSDFDCASGWCCTSGNCGGGMCTYECDSDRDCPYDMLCEHHTCFFACDSDRDCAVGMECEHGNTVCEWD